MAHRAQTPAFLRSQPRHRELRIRFASQGSLLAALARARQEPWIEACRADVARGELWLRMAAGFHVRPPGECRSGAPLRGVAGGIVGG